MFDQTLSHDYMNVSVIDVRLVYQILICVLAFGHFYQSLWNKQLFSHINSVNVGLESSNNVNLSLRRLFRNVFPNHSDCLSEILPLCL